MTRWLLAFALTQLVETPVYVRALGPVRPGWQRVMIAFGASAITHPVVWFSYPLLHGSWIVYLLVAEAFAVGVEALWLRRFGVSRAFWWSLLANALSVAVAMALRATLRWP